MQMAKGNFVVLAHDAALQQSPEAFNRVGVNFAIRIAHLMIDNEVGHELLDGNVAAEFVSDESRVRNLHVVAHKLGETLGVQLRLINMASNDPTPALNDADDWSLGRAASALVWAATFARFATDVAFVHFHDALEQLALLKHGVPNPHSYEPSRTLVDFQIAPKLSCRDALLGIKHKGNRKKPLLQRQVGVVENRVNRDAKRGIAAIAVMPRLTRHRSCARGFAVWTNGRTIPTDALNVTDAVGFGGERFVDRNDVHGYPLLRHLKCTPSGEPCQEKSSTLN